jgi:hypothetical protein
MVVGQRPGLEMERREEKRESVPGHKDGSRECQEHGWEVTGDQAEIGFGMTSQRLPRHQRQAWPHQSPFTVVNHSSSSSTNDADDVRPPEGPPMSLAASQHPSHHPRRLAKPPPSSSSSSDAHDRDPHRPSLLSKRREGAPLSTLRLTHLKTPSQARLPTPTYPDPLLPAPRRFPSDTLPLTPPERSLCPPRLSPDSPPTSPRTSPTPMTNPVPETATSPTTALPSYSMTPSARAGPTSPPCVQSPQTAAVKTFWTS